MRRADQLLEASFHLSRGLVRKGHRHDPVGRDVQAAHQVGDAMGQNASFP